MSIRLSQQGLERSACRGGVGRLDCPIPGPKSSNLSCLTSQPAQPRARKSNLQTCKRNSFLQLSKDDKRPARQDDRLQADNIQRGTPVTPALGKGSSSFQWLRRQEGSLVPCQHGPRSRGPTRLKPVGSGGTSAGARRCDIPAHGGLGPARIPMQGQELPTRPALEYPPHATRAP